MTSNEVYWIGVRITGILTFIGAWIYAIATYGFLFGLGLGWIPAAIVGVVVGLAWPLAVLAVIGLAALIARG